jgi:hypothetical protein
MQFFSTSLAEVRAMKHANRVSFDSSITNNPSAMEKVITNPWYVKKYITLLIFIALLVAVTFLKRMSISEGDSRSQFLPDLTAKSKP